MRPVIITSILTTFAGLALADVPVERMDDDARFSATKGIPPLTVENKAGRVALHMGFECTDKGTLWITRKFDPPQDWRGYGMLHWSLFATTTGEKSHLQVQLFDADNNEVQVRKHLYPKHLGKWLDMSWDFETAKPKGKPVDFSRVKLLIFSAWQDHYGHEAGHKVDYWIGPVSRERSFAPAMLGAVPTEVAPKLDGDLGDPCWQTTPVAEQFFGRKGEDLPAETSHVRLLWDRQNLYVGVECLAQVLDPTLQRLSEFRAVVTEHDGPVFRDDSVEVFLAARDDPGSYAQFVVNALSAQYDGRGTDKAWDATWKAACAKHEGHWTAELAIPWLSLGIEPTAGAMLWANVCRTNVAQDEHSSWSPVGYSFHDYGDFGQVVLLPKPPPVVVRSGTLPTLMMGPNALAPELAGRTGGSVLLRALIDQDGEVKRLAETVEVGAGQRETGGLAVDVERPGEVSLVYSALDPATDAVYFQSPKHTFATAAVERLAVHVEGPCEVFCGGKALTVDAAGNADAYLTKGANVVGVIADGPVRPALTVGDLTIDGSSGWKQNQAPPDNWLSPECDDSDWVPAETTEGKLDPGAGKHFRRTFVVQGTAVRALGDPGDLHLVAGGSQHLPFLVSSTVERPLKSGKLIVQLPPGVEWVAWGDKQPYNWIGEYAGHTAAPVEREGTTWTQHEFAWEVLQPLSFREGAHHSYSNERIHTCPVVIRAANATPGGTQVRFWIEGEDGAVRELPQTLNLEVLPALPAKRPKQIELLLCHGFGAGGYSEPELAALMDTWRDAGFNSYIERTQNRDVYNPLLKERGFRIVGEWLRNPEVRKLCRKDNSFVDLDDKHKGSPWTWLCPTWMVGEGRQAVIDAIAAHLNQHAILPDGLWWDMEFGPKHTCFCSRCLARFAKEQGIDEELTPQTVVEKHEAEWASFYCQLWAEVSAVYGDGIRAAVPDGKMYTYSGYQTTENSGRYCIDWTHMGKGCDVASAGYGWNQGIIADTLAALGDTPLLGGIGYYEPPRNANLKLEYLKLLLAGCKGIMHFHWAPMDGLDYTRIAQAAALVADHEEFFLNGKRADALVEGAPTGTVQALRLGDRLLVVVLNSGSEARTHALSVPTATGSCVEYYTRAEFASAQRLELTVPAHDARACVLTLSQ